MYFSKRVSRLIPIVAALLISACSELSDDLSPSSADLRPDVQQGITGTQVGQYAPDFVIQDSLNNSVTLSNEYTGYSAVVLYFTMWCPICDSHMSYLRHYVVPNYPNVNFLIVDYVTGSVTAARQAQVSNGYTDFTVLADVDQAILDQYNGSMGTTIVIKNDSTVLMNEDFRDGTNLLNTLSTLP